MTRKKSTGREATGEHGDAPTDERRERAEKRNWADEAAEARTSSDPRAMAPQDRSGRPSTGDETI
jgi:hypothetical protein